MSLKHTNKRAMRQRRKSRVRGKISGTPERPRMTIFKSNKHMYAQVIDDVSGVTLASASTVLKGVVEDVAGTKKLEAAKAVGTVVAERCKEKGIEKVVFDRNGYPFTGRVAALANAAREAGLGF